MSGTPDAAAVAQALHRIRGWVDLIRGETSAGHMAHAHAGLALVGIADLLAACALERAPDTTREVTVVTVQVACADGDVLNLLHAEMERLARAGDVVDWLWDGERTVTVPVPYVQGSAFAQGAPDATEAPSER